MPVKVTDWKYPKVRVELTSEDSSVIESMDFQKQQATGLFELAVKFGCCWIDFRDLVSHGVYKGEDLLPSEKQIEVFNKKFFNNAKKYDLKEIKGEYYYYSEKLNLGVFNECISYRG